MIWGGISMNWWRFAPDIDFESERKLRYFGEKSEMNEASWPVPSKAAAKNKTTAASERDLRGSRELPARSTRPKWWIVESWLRDLPSGTVFSGKLSPDTLIWGGLSSEGFLDIRGRFDELTQLYRANPPEIVWKKINKKFGIFLGDRIVIARASKKRGSR